MAEPDDPYERLGIPRDRYGRPMVVPPGGGKATAYTRCTTYVGVLEDTYNLSRWQQRMVALGLAQRPDLVLAAAAHHDDKDELNKVCQSAMDAAAAGAAAGIGTALHKVTQRIDRGEDVELKTLPEAYRADIRAYTDATAALKRIAVEQFVVNDDLKVGGTPDLVVEFNGERYIADKKTGSIEWGAGKIAMQLAMYSRSVFYDHETRTRTPIGVNQDLGIVIHLPAGEGTCRLQWVNISAGWKAVQLATDVRTWRARKKLIYPFDPVELVEEIFPGAEVITLDEQIEAATTRADLEALYRANRSEWTDKHTRAAKLRTTRLHQQSLRNLTQR